MHPTQLNALKSRYGFHSWNKTREQIFLRGFSMRGREINNAQMVRSRSVRLEPGVRVNHAQWTPLAPTAGKQTHANQILVDSIERSSGKLAREALLELLGEFHLPVALAVVKNDVGEIGFVTPDQSFFAFVRGNVVQRLTQIQPAESLRDVARQIDHIFIERPDDAHPVRGALSIEPCDETQRTDEARNFALKPAADKEPAKPRFVLHGIGAFAMQMESNEESQREHLNIENDSEPFVKIFCKGGFIEETDDLIFTQEEDDASIEVFEISAQGDKTCCLYQLEEGRWLNQN